MTKILYDILWWGLYIGVFIYHEVKWCFSPDPRLPSYSEETMMAYHESKMRRLGVSDSIQVSFNEPQLDLDPNKSYKVVKNFPKQYEVMVQVSETQTKIVGYGSVIIVNGELI